MEFCKLEKSDSHKHYATYWDGFSFGPGPFISPHNFALLSHNNCSTSIFPSRLPWWSHTYRELVKSVAVMMDDSIWVSENREQEWTGTLRGLYSHIHTSQSNAILYFMHLLLWECVFIHPFFTEMIRAHFYHFYKIKRNMFYTTDLVLLGCKNYYWKIQCSRCYFINIK